MSVRKVVPELSMAATGPAGIFVANDVPAARRDGSRYSSC